MAGNRPHQLRSHYGKVAYPLLLGQCADIAGIDGQLDLRPLRRLLFSYRLS
jgi:hypothetical protein